MEEEKKYTMAELLAEEDARLAEEAKKREQERIEYQEKLRIEKEQKHQAYLEMKEQKRLEWEAEKERRRIEWEAKKKDALTLLKIKHLLAKNVAKNGYGKQVNKSSLKKKDFSDHQCAKTAENLLKLLIILDNNLTSF